MGRPGTSARDVRRHPGALTFPGLLIWRAGGDRREVQIKYGRALEGGEIQYTQAHRPRVLLVRPAETVESLRISPDRNTA
jgi:hypothetical protein